ncbi:MAG TPA: hypothetical protein VK492_01550 [Chitinophagaceae bacterium]|nr:hypothetical protein [Chitinophagaceae bacterium]
MNTYLSLADKLTNEAVIDSEISKRSSKSLKPTVFNLPEGGFGKLNGFFNGGTIVTIVSTEKSEYVNGLEAAIKSKNEDRIQMHCEAIIERARKNTFKFPTIEGLDDIPIIVDVLYGNSWLAKHLLIAQDTEMALSTSVWSGGKLNLQAFRVLEHRQKKSRMSLRVLTILVPPRLSKIERAVLKAAPQDLSEIHVTGPSVAWSAAGIDYKWQQDGMVYPQQKEEPQIEQHQGVLRQQLSLSAIQRFIIPFYDKHVQENTVDQHQVQQNDTKQQQQQQQQYHQDGQNHQQQQQDQQAGKQHQQQQQEQHQQAQTQQDQNQHQEQQQAQTKQQQNDNKNQHQAATQQVQSGRYWMRDELDGGFAVRPIDEEIYQSLLSRIDFQSMDATQSVKELLRLRERLLTVGLG